MPMLSNLGFTYLIITVLVMIESEVWIIMISLWSLILEKIADKHGNDQFPTNTYVYFLSQVLKWYSIMI